MLAKPGRDKRKAESYNRLYYQQKNLEQGNYDQETNKIVVADGIKPGIEPAGYVFDVSL